jgi:hypothetical protein
MSEHDQLLARIEERLNSLIDDVAEIKDNVKHLHKHETRLTVIENNMNGIVKVTLVALTAGIGAVTRLAFEFFKGQ